MSLSTYDRVMTKISLSDTVLFNEIEILLLRWRTGSPLGIRVVDNLQHDYKISEDAMDDILRQLAKNKHLPLELLEANIFKPLCYTYALNGPDIDIAKVSDKIGGAKSADEFIYNLAVRLKFGGTSKATEIVSKMISNSVDLSPSEKDVYFCDYGSWVTWSETSQDNPFDFVASPDEILKTIINLGLTHRQEGMSHLLFVYSKTAASDLRFPTVADACLYSYFKCTVPGDYCGRTQPWNPEEIRHRKLDPTAFKPRPEAIHQPIKLGDIDKPVRFLKGTAGTYI